MCMYYLYKQLERIVQVHLCNKHPLNEFQRDCYLINYYKAHTALRAPAINCKVEKTNTQL